MGPEYSQAKRRLLEKYLRGEFGLRPESQQIARRQPGERIPLSHAQEQVWVHAQLAPEIPLYNEPVTIHYSGPLDVGVLERAFNEILRRHEAWRTSFVVVDGQPFQEVKDQLTISLPVIDLRNLPDEQRDAAAVAIATADAKIPLDLSQTPLFRTRLIRLRDEEHRLYLTLSHIIFDGVAIYRIFLPELAALYKAYSTGEPSPLSDIAIQYPDYALWERRTCTREAMAKDIEYWREKLSGNLPETYLPTDRPHTRDHTSRGSMYPFRVNSALTNALRNFCRSEGVSLFHVLLAGFAALLYRYSGEERIPIGSVTAGRNRPETQPLLGYFLNTVVVSADLSDKPSFRTLARRARDWTIDALDHDRVPFEHLVRELKVQRNPGRNPLFQALFSLEPPMPEVDPAWRITQMDVDTGASKYDLILELDERSEEILARFHYSTDLFDAATIVRMAAHWQNLVEGAVAEPEQRISELPLLTASEQHQVLVEWNKTEVDLPEARILHKYFEDQVERTPDLIALIYESEQLSYQDLNSRANQLAHRLKKLGVGPDVLVAVSAERSVEMVVALLAIVKAGGAYVPLDPDYPRERLEMMLQDAKAPVILTQEHLLDRVPHNGVHVICLDRDWPTLQTESTENLPAEVNGKNLVYVIYTSGSTGQPKGVANVHEGIVNRLLWMQERYKLGPADRVLQKTPYSFDVSVWEFFWPLMTGAGLAMARPHGHKDPAYLTKLVADQQITTIHFVPSMLSVFLEAEGLERCHVLRRVFASGETLTFDLQQRFFETLNAELHNLYGPTEAAVDVTYWACQENSKVPVVPIGKPIANIQIYILDENLQPMPVGVAGELHIGGIGLARGYLNRPEMTAEKFIPNPFSRQPGARLYKTGDFARFRPDGNIEYLGRIDHQVKLRGFRIELDEIEAALASHPEVQEAVVVAREDVPGEKRLVAYYTATDGNGEAGGAAELRSHLTRKLPEYMVPAAYVRMDRLPLTTNGKLDRKALPKPEGDAYAMRGYEAPQGEIETRLAEIWAETLRVERVGRRDNFFELGGDSLLAVMLIERMRRKDFRVDVRTLFTTPTLAGLAAAADKRANLEVPENLIPRECAAITPQMLPLVKLSQEEIDRIVKGVPGGASNVQDIYPLAPLQEGILFHHLLGGEGDPYLLGTLLSFDTRSRLDSYVEAMQKVIDRHDILRTAAVWEGLMEPVQVVQRRALLLVEEVKLDPTGGDANRQLYARFDPRHHRIDIRQAPLLRLYVAHDEPSGRWLMVELLHHLAGDHVTLEVMQEEVQEHLLKRNPTLPAPQPFRNLVAQARLGISQEDHQAYFRKLLGDVDEPTAPFGLLNVQGDGTGIEEASTLLDSVLAGRIRERARRLGVSAASVCHLAWAQVLARVTGRDDVVFGTVLFGRMQGGPGSDRVMGLFINTLPVRIQIGQKGVEKSVRSVHEQLADLLQHEHASLALAQRCSGVAAPAPLFSALLNYRHSSGAAWTRSAETIQAWEGIEVVHRDERTSYPFTLSVDDLAEGFSLTAQTVASVGAKRVCAYMRTALEGLVEAMEKDPGRAVRTLDVLPLAEREQVLRTFNDTAADYPKEACVHELFEEQVEKHPEKTAVVFENTSLTYAELNRRANQLAHHLRELGIGPDTRVGICVERGLEMVVGLLAILKAGGAYVPLDPRFPLERLRYMLKDSAPAVLLTQWQVKGQISGLAATLPVLDLSAAAPAWAKNSTTNLSRASAGLTPEHLAYVIYTSGSTGAPKGVAVQHHALTNFLHSMRSEPGFTAKDRLLAVTTLSFDIAGLEIYLPLIAGGEVEIATREMAMAPGILAEKLNSGITVMQATPVTWRILIEHGWSGSPGLKILCGGEALPPNIAKELIDKAAELWSVYGPTETTIWSTVARVHYAGKFVSIGHPIANTRVYILDKYGAPVPMGVEGEIYIGGTGVALGYLNRPDLTSERFLNDPFAGADGARMYRTGDLGRWSPDGAIEFLGRNDHQVKIRGFRIELGEIEAALATHPAVREAIVTAREDATGEKRLVSYYTAWNVSGQPNEVAELRSHLSAKLPEYMVPAAYVRMERMPLTANGKLDRKALPTPEGDVYAVRGYEAPHGEIETRMAGIWADLLKVGRVGRKDNFFELGGHSLLAMQVTARIRGMFQLELPVRSVFEAPTIAGLAIEIEQARAMGLKARTSLLQHHPLAIAASIDPEALRMQLEKLSVEEARKLLKLLLEGKQSIEFRA